MNATHHAGPRWYAGGRTGCGLDARDPDVHVTTTTDGRGVTCAACRDALAARQVIHEKVARAEASLLRLAGTVHDAMAIYDAWDRRLAALEELAAGQTARLSDAGASVIHGKTCPKMEHLRGGVLGFLGGTYGHDEYDDSPYAEVDGVVYCGRCHEIIPRSGA